jgi:hypothetical protein
MTREPSPFMQARQRNSPKYSLREMGAATAADRLNLAM